MIGDQAGAHAFAKAVQDALRPLPGWTSISGAIDFCTGLLLSCGYVATRRVIDISGDGANNDGRPVTEARDAAVAAGVTINGLPIVEVEPNLEEYYRDNVIGGPDSFVVVARDSGAFGAAVLRKLLVEVAGIQPPDRGLSDRRSQRFQRRPHRRPPAPAGGTACGSWRRPRRPPARCPASGRE